MELRSHVWSFINKHDLLPPGASVVLGISGGPDSLAMLDALHALAQRGQWRLFVAHLDHRLRPESAEEADFVRGQAAARGLPFHSRAVDVREQAAAARQSLEAAAREARYTFLAQVAQAVGAGHVAVAHTADDQAETVLMRFLRGSGLAGLRGMRPAASLTQWSSSARLIRPLLGTSRAEVEAYCQQQGLQPRRDESNWDPRFLRNRVRHELLPLLETYNPNLRESLARMADVLAGDYDLARSTVLALWAQVAQAQPPAADRVSFDRAKWQALSLAEQRGLLREAVARLRGGLENVDFAPLEAAARFSQEAQPGRACDLVAGLQLAVERERLEVRDWSVPAAVEADDRPLLTPAGQLPSGWTLEAAVLEPGDWSWDEVAAAGQNPWCAYLDADQVRAPLQVRARQAGDWFRPLGMEGRRQKVSDYMVNAKLEAAARDRWPLVVSGDDVVWLAGLRLDERYRVTAETRRVLRLCLRKAGTESQSV